MTKEVRLLLVSIKDTIRKKTDTITKECLYELPKYRICGTPFSAIQRHMKRTLLQMEVYGNVLNFVWRTVFLIFKPFILLQTVSLHCTKNEVFH